MITNEKQYRSTKAIASRLRESLQPRNERKDGDILFKAYMDGVESQLSELESDIEEYEALKSGAIRTFSANTLADLPTILIKARIASGMSQKDLATFLGVAEQQIQRYEAEQYQSASLERLVEIASALNVRINEHAVLPDPEPLAPLNADDWAAFPVAEMAKRGWFDGFTGSAKAAKKAAEELVSTLFARSETSWQPAALHRKTARSSGTVSQAALAAWEARVVIKSKRVQLSASFSPEAITSEWTKNLVSLSARNDGPVLAAERLNNIGIALVIERHLPGTLLDGASIITPEGRPVVALTLRHDRLDNFWFTLLHEIAHLKLHLGKGQLETIFDNLESTSSEVIEKEADEFAHESLIPATSWETCISRYTLTESAVQKDAHRLSIHESIIAGRIRRETGNYTILNRMLGLGMPRDILRQLEE